MDVRSRICCSEFARINRHLGGRSGWRRVCRSWRHSWSTHRKADVYPPPLRHHKHQGNLSRIVRLGRVVRRGSIRRRRGSGPANQSYELKPTVPWPQRHCTNRLYYTPGLSSMSERVTGATALQVHHHRLWRVERGFGGSLRGYGHFRFGSNIFGPIFRPPEDWENIFDPKIGALFVLFGVPRRRWLPSTRFCSGK